MNKDNYIYDKCYLDYFYDLNSRDDYADWCYRQEGINPNNKSFKKGSFMKKIIITIMLVVVLGVVAFGYVSTPVETFPASDPNAPDVIGTKTLYTGNEVTFSIDVEDSNDDTLTVTAKDGVVTQKETVQVMDNGQPATTTITDANGTKVFYIYETTFDIVFRPLVAGVTYPEITITDSHNASVVIYGEIKAVKANVAPVVTGCRVN